MKYKSIFWVTADHLKNVGNFKDYLVDNTDYLVAYHFPASFLKTQSYMEIYSNGEKVYSKRFPAFSSLHPFLKIVQYYMLVYYILIRYVRVGSFALVVIAPFCFLSGIVSFLKKIEFVLWIGDYIPAKTTSVQFMNKIIDYYSEHLPYVLYESPTLAKVYLNKMDETSVSKKYRATVTLGIKKNYTREKKVNKNLRLGFIGVIREQQGLELVFDYLQKNMSENIIFEIVGGGYRLEYYKELAKKMRIKNKIIFHGPVEDVSLIFKKWDIALALYANKKDNLSVYCEPTKIKDYLSYCIPVITTKTTYFHKNIALFGAGEVISENVKNLSNAIEKIQNNYDKYIKGVNKIVDKLEYDKWYADNFKFMEETK